MLKDENQFLTRAAKRTEMMRDAGLGEDKELALAMCSGRCPVDTQWRRVREPYIQV